MKTFFVAMVLFALGCTRPAAEVASQCTLDNGKVLAVSGRPDGVYGVQGEVVDREPLVPWAQLHLDNHGVITPPWLPPAARSATGRTPAPAKAPAIA